MMTHLDSTTAATPPRGCCRVASRGGTSRAEAVERLAPSDVDLARAFAVTLAVTDVATLIDADNKKIGTAPVLEVATGEHAFFVQVAAEMLVADGDMPDEAAVRVLCAELRDAGLAPVLVASGGAGRHHVLARIPDAKVRKRFVARAKTLGFDVRPSRHIRPPLSPHRLGGRSRLVEPAEPLEALVALAPTTSPPARLRGRMRRLAHVGDPGGTYPRQGGGRSDASAMAAAYVLGCVNRGWSFETTLASLLDPQNAAGEKLRREDERARHARAEALYKSACAKVRTSPARRSRPHVDAALGRTLAGLDARPERWFGLLGARLYIAALFCMEIAWRGGDVVVHPGARRLAEHLGVDWHTAAGYFHALQTRDVLALACGGGGRWPSTWRLLEPSLAPEVDTSPTATRTELRHLPSPFGGGVGEVSTSGGGGVYFSGRPDGGGVYFPSCLTEYVAADVFGPRGWFGTRGLGHQAWRVLVLVERAGAAVSEQTVASTLGISIAKARTIASACEEVRLLERVGDGWRRGPGTLVEAARALRTLGTRTWKRAHHAAARRAWREELIAPISRRVLTPATPEVPPSVSAGGGRSNDLLEASQLVTAIVELFGAEVAA